MYYQVTRFYSILGANALNESAVNNIFIAKGRPLSDPLIVHISSISKAKELIDSNSVEGSIFDALAKFWPGPLTIIAKANIKIPTLVTAGTGYVGLRFPAHPLALSLLRECDLPIAAPSANRFGHVSPTMATHVIADLGEKDIHVLDGDTNDEISSLTCLHGIESTIVKIDSDSKQIKILRHGAISMNQLAKALHDEKLLWNVVSDTKKVYNMNQLQEAPGQSITHYASDIPSMIVKGVYFNVNTPLATSEPKLEFTREELKSSVIIDFNGQLKTISNMGLAYRDLSVSGCTIEAAHNLFEYLRWTETVPEAKRVLLPFILLDKNEHNDCIIDGLRDRIHRSGSGKVVELIINN